MQIQYTRKRYGDCTSGANGLGIKLLCHHSFDGDGVLVRREAQRCLANAMYLKPDTGKTLVDVGGLPKFVDAVKKCVARREADDDFLIGRIGFLLTAQKGEVVEQLVNADSVRSHLANVGNLANVLTVDTTFLYTIVQTRGDIGKLFDSVIGDTQVLV